MTNQILPSGVNSFLDDFEAALCLPILMVIIICTIYFIISHTLDIICTVTSTVDGSNDDSESDVEEYNTPISARIRGMLSTMRCSLIPEESTNRATAIALSRPISMAKLNFHQVTGEYSGT